MPNCSSTITSRGDIENGSGPLPQIVGDISGEHNVFSRSASSDKELDELITYSSQKVSDKKDDVSKKPVPDWFVSYCILIPLAFGTGIFLNNVNKYIYRTFSFQYPLFLTSFHMFFTLAATALFLYNRGDSLKMDWHKSKQIAPVAACSILSIGCANASLVYIYPSLSSIIGTTTPLVTVIVSANVFRAHYNIHTWIAILPVCGGMFFSINGEVNFHLLGIGLSLASLLLRAIKNAYQEYFLNDLKLTSMVLLYHMSPWSLALCFLWCIIQEGSVPFFIAASADSTTWAWIILSALASCTYTILMFVLIKRISMMTCVVMNQARVPCTIIVSLLVFGNEVSTGQIYSFIIIFLGVIYHKAYGKRVS